MTIQLPPLRTDADRARAAELRNRSRITGTDLLKTLVTLSTGAVALFFGRLTAGGGAAPERPGILLGALVFFVLAVFAGLAGWLATFQSYYYGAKALEAEARDDRVRYALRRDAMKSFRLACFYGLPLLFAVGVLLSAIHVASGLDVGVGAPGGGDAARVAP